MTPNKAGKVLAQFNVKNAVYVFVGDTKVKPLTFMNTFSKDRNINTTTLYGDGEAQVSLSSDKTISGAIGTTARDDEFEVDLGIAEKLSDGSKAELAITSMKAINFGYETEFIGKDGITKTKKVWCLNVQVTPPNESLTQTQDNITQSSFDYNYTGYGEYVKAAEGEEDYIDPETGGKMRAYTVSKKPGDKGYETFLDSVPTPRKAKPTQEAPNQTEEAPTN